MMLNFHNEIIKSSEFGSNHPRTLFWTTRSLQYQGQMPCKGKYLVECRAIQSRTSQIPSYGSYVP